MTVNVNLAELLQLSPVVVGIAVLALLFVGIFLKIYEYSEIKKLREKTEKLEKRLGKINREIIKNKQQLAYIRGLYEALLRNRHH